MLSKKRPTPRERKQQATTKAKRDRAARNKARRMAIKSGAAKKGDGKDVHHKDQNTANNSKSNLSVRSRSSNRSQNTLIGRRKTLLG